MHCLTMKHTKSLLHVDDTDKSCSNCKHDMGYISGDDHEIIRLLTGHIHGNILKDTLKTKSSIYANMDKFAIEVFKFICKHILRQDWIGTSAENDICLTRNHFYIQQLSKYMRHISSYWSGYQFICGDIILMISLYFAAEKIEKFNYKIYETIKFSNSMSVVED